MSDMDKSKAAAIPSNHNYHSEPYLGFKIYEEKSDKERRISLHSFYDCAIYDVYCMAMRPAIEQIVDKRHPFLGPEAPLWVLGRCQIVL